LVELGVLADPHPPENQNSDTSEQWLTEGQNFDPPQWTTSAPSFAKNKKTIFMAVAKTF
jgi:hypothetical protein